MRRILLLSDTHGHLDPAIWKYVDACDEIWHAGDIGTAAVCDELEKRKPLRAVYGNIDGQDVRIRYPENLRFMCEGVDVWMTHIAGRPENYPAKIKAGMQVRAPKIFICGHSHLLLVKFSQEFRCLHLNPGAAGVHGFHHVKTMLRFVIEGSEIKNMEVIELGPRAAKKTAV
ncbi:MAG: metallophosphoesterase family protein [Bacteroidia bacterium]